jgi:hypothetical protein
LRPTLENPEQALGGPRAGACSIAISQSDLNFGFQVKQKNSRPVRGGSFCLQAEDAYFAGAGAGTPSGFFSQPLQPDFCASAFLGQLAQASFLASLFLPQPQHFSAAGAAALASVFFSQPQAASAEKAAQKATTDMMAISFFIWNFSWYDVFGDERCFPGILPENQMMD